MTFTEAPPFLIGLLYVERRVTYRRLRKEFKLDDEVIEDLGRELLAKQLATDEGGQVLVWLGEKAAAFNEGRGPVDRLGGVEERASASSVTVHGQGRMNIQLRGALAVQ
jgi:hypothetical protein